MNIQTNKSFNIREVARDSSGLPDFQKNSATLQVEIPHVGINRFRTPILVRSEGTVRSHDAFVSMNVSLSAEKGGVNMSRFVTTFQELAEERPVDLGFMEDLVKTLSLKLRDTSEENNLKDVTAKVSYSSPLKQKSLKSNNWGWQYYPVSITSKLKETETSHYIDLVYEYSSTCPCSLSLAKQYEKDFAEGMTTEGTGVAAAHAQRSTAKIRLKVKKNFDFNLESVVGNIRIALPTETQSAVKRIDEQAFAILNGAYPVFVEQASRRLYQCFNQMTGIDDFCIEVNHLESLHSHNATARIYKNVEKRDPYLDITF